MPGVGVLVGVLELVVFALVSMLLGLIGGFVGGTLLLRQSGPVATAEMLADAGRLRLEWTAWEKAATSVLEAVQDVEEVVERKRRRVAARESKERAVDATMNGSDPRAQLRARARAQGHPI